ncbi:hypothetical protein HKD24_02935 [Gluconobacter sp. LMG 31484]|uniref:Phage protein n=1 Tax=Gluconobacter vitians TaxID=2728102 RepID=A0ABR9Y2K0_9PROT|nr:hypothetical protein [Gluconobacter vitians]MBF0858167.1 hypothetical protein [Gluconobacter vitians]
MAKTAIKGMARLQATLNGKVQGVQKNWMARLLERVLRRSAQMQMNIGFLEGATYPKKKSGDRDKSGLAPGAAYADGLPVAAIAYQNEFGGEIEIPEHEQNIYRSVAADGSFRKNGRFVKAKSSNFETTHTVPAHTVTIPARPFMRNAIANNRDQWPALLAAALKQAKGDIDKALDIAAEAIVGQVQEEIRNLGDPANAPSTVRSKGFDKPLIDTGHMLNSVGYEVVSD